MNDQYLHNPHLDGSPFLLKGTLKKVVLLVHGFTATPVEVRRLANNLNRAGFTTAGPLLPGHGESPAALNRLRWQDWYNAMENVFRDLQKAHEKVYVGGESMGALIALLLAGRNPSAAGVLAYSPALRIPLTRAQEIELRLLSPFIAGQAKTDLAGNTTWQGYKVNPLKAVIQLRELQQVVRGELRKVCQPLLVMQGKLDASIDPSSADMVYQEVSSKVKEIHWLEKSGHCLLLDCELHIATRVTMDFLWKT
jgi:carboxylesterase